MIAYFDTSAFIKLLIAEKGSDEARRYWQTVDQVASCELLLIESTATLVRAKKAQRISSATYVSALKLLDDLYQRMNIVGISTEIIAWACALSKTEQLKSADAVHLAAARTLNAQVFIGSDKDLCLAASRQGMTVLNPEMS